jgi:hypothetical protein
MKPSISGGTLHLSYIFSLDEDGAALLRRNIGSAEADPMGPVIQR